MGGPRTGDSGTDVDGLNVCRRDESAGCERDFTREGRNVAFWR